MSNNKSSDAEGLGIFSTITVFGGTAMMGAGIPYFWLPITILIDSISLTQLN
jgi:hypothetical protein